MLSKDFVLAGNATFTVSNGRGEHYTYNVVKSKDKRVHFIRLLTGPDNTSSYTYVGMHNKYDDHVRLTAKSKYTAESKPVMVFNFAMDVINGINVLPTGYNIDHSGSCGMCGRKLTTPESIKAGLGPICRGKI